MKDKRIKENEAVKEMRRIGADSMGVKIMKKKTRYRLIRLTNIRSPLANIIKESMLSRGGDAAVHKLSCACRVQYTDVLIMGTVSQIEHLINKLKIQPYGGKKIIARIRKYL